MITISPFSIQANKEDHIEYNFREEDDIRRYIYYITHGNTTTKPLFAYARGFRHFTSDPIELGDEIISLQLLYNKVSGLRIRGLILTISADELSNQMAFQQIFTIAYRFSDYLFYSGFQTIYGVFFENGRFTIHYAINPVNFVNGTKFHQNHTDILEDQLLCAETIVADVTGRPLDIRFDFDSLEYA